MLFNSYEFIFLFWPVYLIVFFILLRFGLGQWTLSWLVLASFVFYGWWNPAYLPLLLVSIIINFLLGRLLCAAIGPTFRRKFTLVFGLTFNIGLLVYFKYTMFMLENVSSVLSRNCDIDTIVLPLAISFFTFQQVTYLVDSYAGRLKETSFTHYCLFVSFFPQLIAGPIVHHAEMMPQFATDRRKHERFDDLAIGLTMFAIGLFKKAVLADTVAGYASPVFDGAAAGAPLDLLAAWGGALAYTFQLYFDFSGYSDMAIGSARTFGIRLPLNFDSPYKATSIIDFWRRWHMTLSRFLRDYVYIPLGGNAGGLPNRYRNLLITMLLGGLWHGAGWTFVIWGGLHGFFLVVNHAWRRFGRVQATGWAASASNWLLTFVAVVVGWVFFRASDLGAALHMLHAMAGLDGLVLPHAVMARLGPLAGTLEALGVTAQGGGGAAFLETWFWIVSLLAVCLLLPNSQEIMARHEPALGVERHPGPVTATVPYPLGRHHPLLRWRPSPAWAVAVALVFTVGVLALPEVSEFLYFRF